MKLSIITINKDNLNGLRLTASSILSERSKDCEWIVVDGASVDGSEEYVRSLGNQVHRFICEEDSGIYEAMNKGAAISEGEYLIFMNSGDQFVSGTLQGGLLDSFTADIVYGDCLVETPKGTRIEKQPSELTFQSFYASCICHQATFVRREVQLQYPFDEKLRLASCRKFFWDAIIFGGHSVQYLPVPIAIYDTKGLSTTQKPKLLEELEAILPDYLPLGVIKDMYRLKQYDRISRNSKIYPILENIHAFSRKKRIFEKLVIGISRIIFR